MDSFYESLQEKSLGYYEAPSGYPDRSMSYLMLGSEDEIDQIGQCPI
jgi:hypothetical protein